MFLDRAASDGALRIALASAGGGGRAEVERAVSAIEPTVQAVIADDSARGLLREDFDFLAFRASCAAVVLTMDSALPSGAWRRVESLIIGGLQARDQMNE